MANSTQLKGITFLAVSALSMSAFLSPAIHAQEAPARDGAPAGVSQSVEITDEKIAAYAMARDRVEEIKERWNSRLDGSESGPQIEEMQDSANAEMRVAIQTAGLSVSEYNEIAVAAQTDKELRRKISKAKSG